jgi:asparagine synthase (glutamine-hydrolysing)
MCGIIGVASTLAVSDRSGLSLGREAIRHRGPDDLGEWWSADGCVGLGHQRLAVIDLSRAAHQPMCSASTASVIAFNGEIYNFIALRQELIARRHRFRSHSDTEVVLAAYDEWGTSCLTHLDGMFAFALYDADERTIFLARDRVGEKPLYYAVFDETLVFSSELKGLIGCAPQFRRVSTASLDCYLGMGYLPGDLCILEGVRKLPPAHAMTFEVETARVQIWRYWELPIEAAGSAPTALPALVEELEVVLADAVRRQLVADVPVGVLLSGGLDSSIITALAARATTKLNTYTVGFPGHESYDETAHARIVASYFGTSHVELSASETTPSLLPTLARQFDEPLIDSSMIPTYLVSSLVRRACTVAVGGDGGDELFGGYQHYSRLATLSAVSRWIPGFLLESIGRGAAAAMPLGARGRNWALALTALAQHGVPQIALYFDRRARLRLLRSLDQVSMTSEETWRTRAAVNGDIVTRATRTDFANYLPEDILVKVDRASMLTSLEVRAPFLDRPVMEFAFGRVPSAMKVAGGKRKILLRALAAKILPATVDADRKQGFAPPMASWLRTARWSEFVRGVLLDPGQSVFDHREVERIWNGQMNGKQNGERLFGLLMFELWRKQYGITVSQGAC